MQNGQPEHSERYRRLFASMLAVLVKREFDYWLRDGEALDLACYGTLSAAIQAIRRSIEINSQFPDPKLRHSLAIQEAAILSGTSTETRDHAKQLILEARKKSFEIYIAEKKANHQREEFRASLKNLMLEVRQWGYEHSRFVNKMAALYRQRELEIRQLPLPDEVGMAAIAELDQLFEAALELSRLS